MTAPKGNQLILDAVDGFRQAGSLDDLWERLHRPLAGFGITGLLYACEAMPDISKLDFSLILSSYDRAYMDAALASGLFYSNEFTQMAVAETAPALWGDTSRLDRMTPEKKRALDLDFDYGVTTGVTVPMHFHNGLGTSGVGCHAAHMSWEEFDRLWGENGHTITAIINAFDIRVRQDHADDIFPLTARERECLLWLIAGLRPQQIAFRLGTHPKTVEKQINSAKHKLKATTVAQALATALIFGLISP